MTNFVTEFGSLNKYTKGKVETISGSPKEYVFSNVFEVASKSAPYEKVAVAVNLQYVIECIRAEGVSSWMAASHDEFCFVMDGKVEVEYIKLDDLNSIVSSEKEGTVLVKGEPVGQPMGSIELNRGHQAMLPKGAAYRFKAANPSVLIQQSIVGDLTVQKWADICIKQSQAT